MNPNKKLYLVLMYLKYILTNIFSYFEITKYTGGNYDPENYSFKMKKITKKVIFIYIIRTNTSNCIVSSLKYFTYLNNLGSNFKFFYRLNKKLHFLW